MKITFRTLMPVLLIVAVLGTVWAGGQKDGGAQGTAKPTAKVNVAVAVEKGYFAEYGIDAQVTIVESGPVEMAAMRADTPTLDFGYIGPGVAWNPIDSTGNSLSFVFFDNLGNSERMLAKKGLFKDANNNRRYDYSELHDGLKGKTVYIEVGTTPGGWFKNLLAAINERYAAGDRLWIHCEDAAYLSGYTAPNNKAENRVLVVNYQNSNIPAGMATGAGNISVDIAVAYEPVPSTILKNTNSVEQVADINSLPRERVFPSTFVANTKWLQANPELAKNCIYAVYKAALYRASNPDEAMRISERLCARPDGTFDANAYFFPSSSDYKDWFAAADAIGYLFLRSLYDERLSNIPQGTTPKSFEQAFDLTYMLQAIKEL
jgi:ABC-type nitrate/sulfonate/bicarbonate transport system substrate-binding protein